VVGVRRVAGGLLADTSDFMLIEAMKSAGPKMMVSSRGEAAAIASTFISPWRSRSGLRCDAADLEAHRLLDLGEQQVQRFDLLGVLHFGSMRQSRLAPAPSTT